MINDREKTVVVGETDYQIRRLSPAKGSWAYFRLMASAGALAAEQKPSSSDTPPSESDLETMRNLTPEQRARNLTTLAYLKLSFDDLQFLQQECAKCASRWEVKPNDVRVPMPLTLADGRWVDEDLSQDASFLTQLTTEVITFSISGFFDASTARKST